MRSGYLEIVEEYGIERAQLDEVVINGIPLAELRRLAADDWPELENNPINLGYFASLVSARQMRERGEVPPNYTEITSCQGCGTVPIFAGVPESVIGCPWCFNRHSGRPIPVSGISR